MWKSLISGYDNVWIYFQVLFVYPPEKQLPLKYKDLLSFCFPGGLEVRCLLDGLLSLYFEFVSYQRSLICLLKSNHKEL